MWDFGQVGTVSLWKSGPLFSTGTGKAELMAVELRLNLRSPICDAGWLRRRGKREKDGIDLAPSCPQHLQSPAGLHPQETRFSPQVGRAPFVSLRRPEV